MGFESFLANAVNQNIGPLGAIGRFPLGLAGKFIGVPGIGPNFETVQNTPNPAMLGGLLGFGLNRLIG